IQVEKILDLCGENNGGDPRGEAGGHWIGNEFNDVPETGQTEKDNNDAGHDRGGGQSAITIFTGDVVDNDDEGAGGSADLDTAAAESGNQKSGNDRGEEPHSRRRKSGLSGDILRDRGDTERH